MAELKTWHKAGMQEAETWINSVDTLSIMVTGKTGAGKTSLINGLIGEKVGIEGKTLDPQTAQVTTIRRNLQGISVTIWDTPGLQDGTCRERESTFAT